MFSVTVLSIASPTLMPRGASKLHIDIFSGIFHIAYMMKQGGTAMEGWTFWNAGNTWLGRRLSDNKMVHGGTYKAVLFNAQYAD